MKDENIKFEINRKGITAFVLNFILVGLGYAYSKHFGRAILSFIGYLIFAVILTYISTYNSIFIWLGLPVNLFFAWDAYRMALKKHYLHSKKE